MASREQIIQAARLHDPSIGDDAMIAHGEWGYWIGSVYISKTSVHEATAHIKVLKQESYIEYLESIALSLMDTVRGNEFPITDPNASPSLAGFSVSIYTARSEIENQRKQRKS